MEQLDKVLLWTKCSWRQRPMADSGSPEWRKRAAVAFGARGARGKGKEGKWIEFGLLVLLGRRGRE
jgi:hypothetical protein